MFSARPVILALLFLAPIGVRHLSDHTEPGATSTTRTEIAAPTSTPALAQLDDLEVLPERRGGYRRSLFPHWVTHPDGCSTRERVLIEESLTPAKVSARYCTVRSGTWVSVYDGRRVTSPRELEIDHVVALKEAWESGAWAWEPARRKAFANDLGNPASLVAVSSATNQSKSDKDPANWRPPLRSARCDYATNWVRVKAAWDLSVDRAEAAALRRMLTTSC